MQLYLIKITSNPVDQFSMQNKDNHIHAVKGKKKIKVVSSPTKNLRPIIEKKIAYKE